MEQGCIRCLWDASFSPGLCRRESTKQLRKRKTFMKVELSMCSDGQWADGNKPGGIKFEQGSSLWAEPLSGEKSRPIQYVFP